MRTQNIGHSGRYNGHMLQITPSIVIDDSEIEERFIRSSGPGGQNVNKVSSAVQLRFDVARSPSFDDTVRARLTALAGQRLTKDGVLSLGGGAVLAEQTRRLLQSHTVALLDVDLSHATGRVGLNRDRPVLALNPRAQLKALLEQRMPLYREVASITVDTNGRSAKQVVEVLADALASPA